MYFFTDWNKSANGSLVVWVAGLDSENEGDCYLGVSLESN